MNAMLPTELREQQSGDDSRELPNLQDYLRILFRFKWGLVALMMACGLIAVLRAHSQTPIYQASATMLIERQAARFVSIEEVYRANQGYDFGEYYQTQYEILRSRPIAERVVDKLGTPAFAPRVVADQGFSWRKLIPGGSKEQPVVAEPAAVDRNVAVATVQGGVSIVPVRNSQLVRIQFRNADPEFAATLANAHAQAYIEETLEGRVQMSQTASNWLNERTAGLREKLEQSEGALQEFRDRERLIDVGGVDGMAASELSLAGDRLAEARRERADKEAAYRQVEEASRRGALDQLPALLASPLVSDLKQSAVVAERAVSELAGRYGPKHPRRLEAEATLLTAQSALKQQLELVASGIDRDYQAARLRENQLSGEMGSAKGEVRALNRKQYELQALQRDVDSNRELYQVFQNRFKETAASGGVQSANARLIEAAMPNRAPVYPNKQRSAMVGLLIGLALGVALALVLDHLDNTLKGADDVERRLGLPVLGLVPRLPDSSDLAEAPIGYFAAHPQSSFAEAIRTIRTGVLLSAVDQDHKRLLITSSVPGEGKTTLSMNLAFSLGQMKKVLLIDADMRRPALHRGLPDQRQSPGLSEFIAGEAKVSDCLRQLPNSNVFVMPAGVAPPNPLEILSSRKFAEALETLGSKFDHILIDCAPACAVSDALVLSRLVHGVIYVVRSDATQWQVARTGVKRLARIEAPVIGAVVNQVVARKGGYGYGKYYYHGDGYYSDYGYAKRKKR
ncbi:MAG: polysaccharide biosynthesis tyrosine autokinase [Pseudomonadota bacterium]|nr:polysaccharide biosynthesis tyrosine autokinase [Pseudomonadota bacterium]